MDIAIWLRTLGLGKYEAAFRENEIDETVLPSLTEEHLKQVGVTALGHRVKLLDAVAAPRNDASGKTPAASTAVWPLSLRLAYWVTAALVLAGLGLGTVMVQFVHTPALRFELTQAARHPEWEQHCGRPWWSLRQ
jgi:hypothetical protein